MKLTDDQMYDLWEKSKNNMVVFSRRLESLVAQGYDAEANAMTVASVGVVNAYELRIAQLEASVAILSDLGSKQSPAQVQAPMQKLPDGCLWAVTKGGVSICQPPRRMPAVDPAQVRDAALEEAANLCREMYRENYPDAHDYETGEEYQAIRNLKSQSEAAK